MTETALNYTFRQMPNSPPQCDFSGISVDELTRLTEGYLLDCDYRDYRMQSPRTIATRRIRHPPHLHLEPALVPAPS